VCLGQPAVELVRHGGAFTPRLGGAAAKLAMAAACAGPPIAPAGPAAEDRCDFYPPVVAAPLA
jgi:hypothetical protein